MKVLLLFYTILIVFANATTQNIIDGIAYKIDDNIITMHEIQNIQKQFKVSKKEAIDILIIAKLKENEIKRLNINITDSRVEDEINNIIINNKITKEVFTKGIQSQGLSLEEYKNQLKEHLINRELIQKILQTNSSIASDDELKKYYNAHKDQFKIPTKITAISYTSNSDEELQKVIANPLLRNPYVEVKNEVINIKHIPPQIINVFINTPSKAFTPILNSGNTLIAFYIKEKGDLEIVPFDEIKQSVIQKYAEVKEKEILGEYFNKVKATTKIQQIRE